MKRFAFLMTLIVALVVGCDSYDDTFLKEDIKDIKDEIGNLDDRVTALERLCGEMNTNINSINSLVSAIASRDYIVSVIPLMENRAEVGYTITFANSNPINIYHGTDGSNGFSPVIGVQQHADGIYYWTLNDAWLLDDAGKKVKAEGRDGREVTPELKIEDGYWYVRYNGGSSWQQLGKATGEDGDNIFSSVNQDSGNVYFNLSNGTTITVPKCNCSDNGSGNVGVTEMIDGLTVTWAADISSTQKNVLRFLIGNMVHVLGGTFKMGSEESDAESGERPVHSVTLSSYRINKYEVTQEEWMAVMGKNPSKFSGADLPVENVSWNTIVNDFLPELNRLTGLSFRLPTEAEWEYAARGGSRSQGYKYCGSNVIDDIAWYTINSDETHVVGNKLPNELGLYDMSGNVSEWCSDWYDSYSSSSQLNPVGPEFGSRRVLRGGYWNDFARSCRVSCRVNYYPDYGNSFTGFRLALSSSDGGNAGDSSDDDPIVGGFTETIGDLTVIWANSVTASQKQILTQLLNNMVYVQGGTFQMGSKDSDAYSNESPVFNVTLSSYRINKYEVTQEEWVAVMGSNPSYFSGANLPVEDVSWNSIMYYFLPELYRLTGLNFRLPTEAEWEYAARGGNRSQGCKYSGSNTINDIAWCHDNSDPDADGARSPHAVGTKQANELGLYDMSGNVWEWCSDWYGNYLPSSQSNPTGPLTGSTRVFRGGSWFNYASYCRVSNRNNNDPSDSSYDLGLRLAL